MYRELADWFHLITAPEDYAVEARFYSDLLRDSARIPVRHVLELGSGGGNNASHMKNEFDLTLTDVSEEMLAISRDLNPSCEHILGDMRTLRLRQEFDGVFIHDAIDYMTTREDLAAAIQTASVHLRTGGACVMAPDYVRETFREGTDHGGHDGEARACRYLEWTWDPDPRDSTYEVAFALLLRDENGDTRVEHDRHVAGLFARDAWLEVIQAAGLEASVHSGIPKETAADVFVGVKPE